MAAALFFIFAALATATYAALNPASGIVMKAEGDGGSGGGSDGWDLPDDFDLPF